MKLTNLSLLLALAISIYFSVKPPTPSRGLPDLEKGDTPGLVRDKGEGSAQSESRQTSPGRNADTAISENGNRRIENFYLAKKKLVSIFSGYERTFYCDCAYTGKLVDLRSCGYKPLNPDDERSRLIEWEHIVPAHAFGRSFKEWREGSPDCVDKHGSRYKGRKCAEKASVAFNFMEADLYNLVPAIGEVNRTRSNFEFAMLPNAQNIFGLCDFKTDGRVVEPRKEVRGIIARTYKYMDYAYPGRGIISRKNIKLFEAWNKMYPISAKEREIYRRIENVQGNKNPFWTEELVRNMTRGAEDKSPDL